MSPIGLAIDDKGNIEFGKVGSNEEMSHFVVSLLGPFKGEGGGSRIETRVWLEQGVAAIHKLEESEICPALCYEDAYP